MVLDLYEEVWRIQIVDCRQYPTETMVLPRLSKLDLQPWVILLFYLFLDKTTHVWTLKKYCHCVRSKEVTMERDYLILAAILNLLSR